MVKWNINNGEIHEFQIFLKKNKFRLSALLQYEASTRFER
jgi:hypothetical protein